MPIPDLRLRSPTPGLVALPWDQPLSDWTALQVDLRDVPVGLSRHLVRFIHVDGALWALKELPRRIADREYHVLRQLETRHLPAVRAVGLVRQNDNAILVTRFLAGSWQYRRLFQRLPPDAAKHRQRLLDAMVNLVVDLHRNGVFWGDCSLANTLFTRDGQILQAWLVDAETSEIHPELSAGQRAHDVAILVENITGDLIDMAARWDRLEDLFDPLVEQAQELPSRYEHLWQLLHSEAVVTFTDRYAIEAHLRQLHEAGFAVDEISLVPDPTEPDSDRLRLRVVVADRSFHADQLRELTGLDVGEGQAQILLNDLRAYQAREEHRSGQPIPEHTAAQRWRDEVLNPGMQRAMQAVGEGGAIQAYCDLLEVRWLLSEQAGRDVGDDAALAALAERRMPPDSAAQGLVVETDTTQMPVLTARLPDELAAAQPTRPEWGDS